MNKRIIYLICLISIGLMSACTVGLHSFNTVGTSFDPNSMRIEVNMNNFDLLGEVEVSVIYRTYFGSIVVFDQINDEPFNKRLTRDVNFIGNREMNLSSSIKKATYKVLEKFPNADYYVPVFKEKKIDGMFLGSNIKEVVRFKVYKIKK